jgi:hypothetical protein
LVGSDAAYTEAMVESASAVNGIRDQVPPERLFKHFPPLPEMLLTTPWNGRAIKKIRPPKPTDDAARDVALFLKMIRSQRSYAFEVSEKELERVRASSVINELFSIRASELKLLSDAVSIRSCSFLTPSIRLHPSVIDSEESIRKLGQSLRSDKPNQAKKKKVRKLARQVSKELAAAVDDSVLEMIKSSKT